MKYVLKIFPIVFVLIYTVVFILLLDFSRLYESAWIIAIIDIPLSSVFYKIISIFHIPRNIFFDIVFLYVIGCVQYGIIGCLCSKLMHVIMIFIKMKK